MQTDILIIGGGIAGVSVAAELAPFARVVLAEAEATLAHHASSRSAALYEPYYGPPPVVELSKASGEFLENAGVLSPRGVMMIAAPGEEEAFARDAEDMHLDPIPVDQAGALFPALDPAKLSRAALADHAFDIDTDRLIQSYARTARTNGAQFFEKSPISQISRTATGWRAMLPGGEVAARLVINAAGAWADSVAALAGVGTLGLQPKRRSMARIPAPGGLDPARWPMVFGAGETWYAKPDAGALIVSPADADPVDPHDAWAEDMTLAEGLARYEAVSRYPVDRLLSSWAGLRTFAPDGVPVMGRDAKAPDFIWCAGQGGYGFQSAPAAARLVADIALDRPVDAGLAASLSPARFG